MSKITRTTRRELLAHACADDKHFLSDHKTLKAAYENCTDPSAICWAFEQIGLDDDRRLRDAAREIALGVFSKHFNEDDPAVSTVFRWLRLGREEDRSAAYSAAESAARSAAYSAAWSAAWSSAESAAWSAVYLAADSAAYSAALSAASSAACDIIRKHLPWGSF